MTHDQANEAFAQRLLDAMLGLSGGQGNPRAIDTVQQPAMPVVRGPADSIVGQVADTDERRNNCTQACGVSGCSRLRAQRGGSQAAGEAQGNAAGAGEGEGVKA